MVRTVRVAAILMVVTLATAQAHAAALSEAILALAENILGRGTVISVRTTDDDGQALMRWESATYRSSNTLPTTRHLVYGEAELATGSIMGRLPQIVRVRFTIMRKNTMLATGENWRGRGVTMVFSSQLGGGMLKPGDFVPDSTRQRNRQQGGDAAKEI